MPVVWLALFTLALTIVVLFPPRRFAVLAVLAFFFVLPVAEFVPLFLLAEGLYLWRFGAAYQQLPLWQAVTAGALLIVSWVLLLRQYLIADVSGTPYAGRHRYFWPLVVLAKGVQQTRGIVFAPEHKLKLDVIKQPGAKNARAIVYVHGGGWIMGNRFFQGRPFLLHLAQQGYVCFSIDYRLSPWATFPAHIIDVKRAIAWVREHAVEHGADPEKIIIVGNSAGGHLAALAALSPDYKQWQPGFENARTDVSAAVCFYGIYDFDDLQSRWPHRGLEWLWRFLIIKQRRTQAAELWQAASPAYHLKPGAPPFLLVHGTNDTMVPIQEARAFAKRLQAITRVELLEIRGAQHAFELAISPRARAAVHAAERFLATI